MECNCGGTIKNFETLDKEIIGNELWVGTSGYCDKCKQRYVWDEIYIFNRIENIEKADG